MSKNKPKIKKSRSSGAAPLPFGPPPDPGRIVLNRSSLLQSLAELGVHESKEELRSGVTRLRSKIEKGLKEPAILAADDPNAIEFRKDVLLSELDQIIASKTVERAMYYLKRLDRGVRTFQPGKVNDINLLRWKEYPEVLTDSLWTVPKRDTHGAHLGWYWGNFIPQIPHQMMLRYTKKGDWVLDPFAGSGTTLIECRRLGRNGIGIELNEEVAAAAGERIWMEPNPDSVISEMIVGDSRTIDGKALLSKHKLKKAQLLIMHPPYADIIAFSEDERDLSKSDSVENYLKMFGEVVDNMTPLLEKRRYLALVIGDKYSRGEWIPLGFRCMETVLERGYSLKSIVVKNFDETRAKRDQKQLWRYRALVGGFYIFKHEYIFVFKKR
ncbi:MAG TPA: DNA methyltransferase [Blastocatellia bacterium]|nr:DNA methyltransferase [Blastocatellia bacterium]